MRIAVFHTSLDNIGGAERVALILARGLDADLYTTNIDRKMIERMGFSSERIFSIGKIPSNPPYRQEFAKYRFRFLNLRKKYDYYIITGDWAISGAVNNRPNLWYAHSPIRELHDLNGYTRKNIVPDWATPIFNLWAAINRIQFRRYSAKANIIACNSLNTKRRIDRYVLRPASVIPPPVNLEKFIHNESNDYWFSVNRLINYKRIELQIEAFRNMPKRRLIIVGSYEKATHFLKYKNDLVKNLPSNIKIISHVRQDELVKLYSECIGLITTSKDEDFGMNVIESYASGKPVVAVNEGGYKETVIDKETGILIAPNSNAIVEAVQTIENEIENGKDYKERCISEAKKYSSEKFVAKIKQEILRQLKKSG